MSSASPSTAGLSDGPNKKSRLLELIQLPDTLDDAVLQPGNSSAQPHLPADEAQRQLGTLQLGSGDDHTTPVQAVTAASTDVPAGTDTSMTAADTLSERLPAKELSQPAVEGANAARKATQVESAAAAVDEQAGTIFQREASHEAAPSDPGVCVSFDLGAGSSA
jgi:hypothetical protein